jgi:hypothetical protein
MRTLALMLLALGCESVEPHPTADPPPLATAEAPPPRSPAPPKQAQARPPATVHTPSTPAETVATSIEDLLPHATRIVEPDLLRLLATKWATFDKRREVVKIDFCIDHEGVPHDVVIVRHPRGDIEPARIIRRALRRWRFDPTVVGRCTRAEYQLSVDRRIVVRGPTGHRSRLLPHLANPPIDVKLQSADLVRLVDHGVVPPRS